MANKSKLRDDIAKSQWQLKEQARKLLEGRENARGECAIVFNVRLIGRAKRFARVLKPINGWTNAKCT